MITLKDIEDTLETLLDTLNARPTMENYINFERELDFYSDIYKDENGVRPHWKCRELRGQFSRGAREVEKNFNALPNKWELYCSL